MQWTREAPTVPGWYWYRCGDTQPEVYQYTDSFPTMDENHPREWSGPIPEPEESTPAPGDGEPE